MRHLEMAQKFAPYHLYWLEEPIYPPEDFKSLARLGPIKWYPHRFRGERLHGFSIPRNA